MKTLGLDEAGRGCVLGPLVVGAFCFEGDSDELVRQAGATDSKKLSARKRQRIRGLLPDLGQCGVAGSTQQQSTAATSINSRKQHFSSSLDDIDQIE